MAWNPSESKETILLFLWVVLRIHYFLPVNARAVFGNGNGNLKGHIKNTSADCKINLLFVIYCFLGARLCDLPER